MSKSPDNVIEQVGPVVAKKAKQAGHSAARFITKFTIDTNPAHTRRVFMLKGALMGVVAGIGTATVLFSRIGRAKYKP